MKNWIIGIAFVGVCCVAAFVALRPAPVVHTVVQKPATPVLLAATQNAPFDCKISIQNVDGFRVLTSNGVPKHKVGLFSTPIEEQDHEVKLPATPRKAEHSTHVQVSGYSIAGVPFKPGSEHFFQADRSLGWRYEATSGALDLALDESFGTVTERGAYSYFGMPTKLLEEIGVSPDKHSGLVGWAVDGFPIYALFGYADGTDMTSEIVPMTSSYQLKTGDRPSELRQPGGRYDGTFTADWKYEDGSGVLDNCNGRFTKTPEFPDGTYAYFLTESFPIVPRCVWGQLN